MKEPFISKQIANSIYSKLNRLVYYIYHVKEITTEDFRRLFGSYYIRRYGKNLDNKRLINCQNMAYRQLLHKDKINMDMSFKKFFEYICCILNYDIEAITIRVKNNKTGEIETYSSDDNIDDLIAKYRKPKAEKSVIILEKIDRPKSELKNNE